jgi:hypothetical protein
MKCKTARPKPSAAASSSAKLSPPPKKEPDRASGSALFFSAFQVLPPPDEYGIKAPASQIVGIVFMNVFYEFHKIVKELQNRKIKYAVIGGVAMAFHAYARFTKDIDILVSGSDEHDRIIEEALEAHSEHTGTVRVAKKEDLIWLKCQRNSPLDQADIATLKDESYEEH